MKHSKRGHAALTAAFWLLPAAIISLVPFLVTRVYYMVADDYLLNYIANGSFGTAGSAHLVYIRAVIGGVLKALYLLAPGVNWYAAMLAVFTVLSFTVFYRAVWDASHSVLCLLPVLLIDALTVPYFFSYTVIAFYMAAAGVVLWYGAWRRETPRTGEGICGSLFLAAAVCLRRDTVLPSVVLTAPLLLGVLRFRLSARQGCGHSCRSGERLCAAKGNAPGETAAEALTPPGGAGMSRLRLRGPSRAVAVPVLLLAALLLLTGAAEKRAYSDSGWQSFLRYTSARSSVVDYPEADYQAYVSEFRRIGLSGLDYNLLLGWKYAEKPVYTEKVLTEAADIGRASVTPERRIRYVRSVFTPARRLYLLLPLLVFLMLLLLAKRYPFLGGAGALLCFYGIVFALTFVRMRFVIRVAAPVAAVSMLTLLVMTPRRIGRAPETGGPPDAAPASGGQPRRMSVSCLLRGTAALLCLLLFLYSGQSFMRDYLESNRVSRSSSDEPPKNAIVDEIASHPDTLYIMDAGVMSILYFFGTPVTAVKPTHRFDNVVRSGSWDTFSPRYYAQVSRFLSDPDRLLTSLVTSGNVRYVSGSADGIRDFLVEHTGQKVIWTEQGFERLSSKVYRFHFQNRAGRESSRHS